MEWRGRRRSSNVEDRRGAGLGRGAAVGGLGTVVLALLVMFLGGDPRVVLEGVQQPDVPRPSGPEQPYVESAAEAEQRELVAVVLAETEDVWRELFRARGAEYAEPQLVLYTGRTQSACGLGAPAMGPFYCPADRRVFIDLSFFDDLATRYGAPGEFARAYVLAHEVGHHVQNLLGISGRVQSTRRQLPEREANALSVRLELQADCFAGVWANRSREALALTPADLEAALRAASAVGDDRLQKSARGEVAPDSFTHGSSEQRMRWFRQGFESGRMDACDTFATTRL